MDLKLTPADLAPLSAAQKDAVLTALFLALVADGNPNAEELGAFEATIASLPWGKSIDELKEKTKAVSRRLQMADRADKIALVNEVAENVPGDDLREKVVIAMASIVTADKIVTRGEQATVGAFIVAFGLSSDRVERIKKAVRGD